MADTRPALPRTVVSLGVVSLLTDASSEMVFPLLPVFLATLTLAPERALGWIEGVAELTAAFVKIGAGRLADRTRSKKPLVLAGYGLSSLVRPLIALAWWWPQVLGIRFLDRVGKGIRSSPRDALIAAVADPSQRGRAYGFHRALDNTGAVVGPLLAALLLGVLELPLRWVFACTLVPGLLSLAALQWGVREEPRPETSPEPGPMQACAAAEPLGSRFWRALGVMMLFNLSASSDAFLLLRARDLGWAPAALPLLWAASSAVRALFAAPGGALSDRLGRRTLLGCAWLVYALAYLGFALVRSPWGFVAVLLVYSFYYPLSEGVERAAIADLAPARGRGRAFGWFHGGLGFTALGASVLFGLVWRSLGAPVAFACGAGVAVLALVGLLVVFPSIPTHRPAA